VLPEEIADYRPLNPKMGLSAYAVVPSVAAENDRRVRVKHHTHDGNESDAGADQRAPT
jgi:hypothetical protein